jgi:exopolysaccharide production protein ExoZ
MENRLKSLDWLRGLMAVSIMLYHLRDRYECGTVLGRLGTYGVSIFFILSGLSMAIAYDRYIKDLRSSGAFFIRRLFRIWPLLWLAVGLHIVSMYRHGTSVSVAEILLNVSTLFGFIAPVHYMNMGAWSIGNEMVYYSLTPLLIGAYHFRRWLGNSITLIASMIGILFAFRLLDPRMPIESQWAVYVNPFNNLFLYCMGLAMYYTFRDAKISSRWYIGLLVGAIAAFVFYPSSGDSINIVTGVPRLAFSVISVAIVLGFWKCPPRLPDFIGNRLEQLGVATYGVYLLHPLVMQWTQPRLEALGIYEWHVFVLLVVGTTIALALFTYRFLESPLIKLGKRLTQVRSGTTAPAEVKLNALLLTLPRAGNEPKPNGLYSHPGDGS